MRLPLGPLTPLVLLASAFALGCPGSQPPLRTPASPAAVAPSTTEPVVVRMSKTGLGFRLSDADGADATEHAKPAVATPMTAADTKRILDRLPPPRPDPDA